MLSWYRAAGSTEPFWYSVKIASAHIIMHALLLLLLRQVHAAMVVAQPGACARRQKDDAMAHRAPTLSVVQQQQLPFTWRGGR
jgi:hypothetical protein